MKQLDKLVDVVDIRDISHEDIVAREMAIIKVRATKEQRSAKKFSILEHIGFTKAEVEEAQDTIIGRMTIEGAPYLKPSHYPVFDCANRCGKDGQR